MSKRGLPAEGGGAFQGISDIPIPKALLQGFTPPPKRHKEIEPVAVTIKAATTISKPDPTGNAGNTQEIDPEQMGDVLNAAGVDLREEESLLSKGLLNEPGGLAGARLLHAPKDGDIRGMLLNYEYLKTKIERIAAAQGLKLATDDGTNLGGLSQDPLGLLSISCEEWLSTIIEEAAAYSRHRRLSRNPTSLSNQSEISKALKLLAKRDKDAEAKHAALKVKLGLSDSLGEDNKESEESMQRAANDTARMMAASIGRKKKFSWLNDGGPSAIGGGARSQSRRQNNDPVKFKEIREENGIIMRDILPALERKHMGVKKSLIRGYCKMRN